MSYAIIGFGKIGQALAKAFARNGIEVSVATTRDPESFAADAAEIGREGKRCARRCGARSWYSVLGEAFGLNLFSECLSKAATHWPIYEKFEENCDWLLWAAFDAKRILRKQIIKFQKLCR